MLTNPTTLILLWPLFIRSTVDNLIRWYETDLFNFASKLLISISINLNDG